MSSLCIIVSTSSITNTCSPPHRIFTLPRMEYNSTTHILKTRTMVHLSQRPQHPNQAPNFLPKMPQDPSHGLYITHPPILPSHISQSTANISTTLPPYHFRRKETTISMSTLSNFVSSLLLDIATYIVVVIFAVGPLLIYQETNIWCVIMSGWAAVFGVWACVCE